MLSASSGGAHTQRSCASSVAHSLERQLALVTAAFQVSARDLVSRNPVQLEHQNSVLTAHGGKRVSGRARVRRRQQCASEQREKY
jgi:hypothetical protein